MLRPHPERLLLRGAGDGERAVPDARGREHGAKDSRGAGSVEALDVEARPQIGGLPHDEAGDHAGGAGSECDVASIPSGDS